ncbi:MAG TPA: dNTP triphosphohydrolase [Solirubrobacterales bacterium]|nr:dNTP triphosphohydrolase [Solirubrobacterales bacterium]
MGVSLSDYNFLSERETARYNVTDPPRHEEDRRSPFERDRSRIIHSAAFRSLQGKTQIFEPQAADFMRSRLTHSIEVSQIGRGLAKRFGVPGSLVETACLAHDLGHPPFGHTGEDALNERMDEHGGFEGNAQTFRIVTRIEPKHKDYSGLDLCRASLLALIKYPFERNEATKDKKFLYKDDTTEDEMVWLYDGSRQSLLSESNPRPPRTLPCQLMDWADDIAYSVHDLEDGIASGLLRPSTWRSDHFMDTIFKSVRGAPNVWVEGQSAPSEEDVAAVLTELVDALSAWEPEIPLDVIRELSRKFINGFVVAGEVVENGPGDSLFDFKLVIPWEDRVRNQVLKAITIEYLLKSDITAGAFFKGHEILDRLFDAFLKSCKELPLRNRYLLFPRRMRPQLREVADNQSDLRRLICDYLGSLTEGQVRRLYARFFEPGHAPV